MHRNPELERAQWALQEELSQLAQALASPYRLQLLDWLSQNHYSVEQLAVRIGQSVASTSAHLKVLRQAQLVVGERDGRRIIYRHSSRQLVQLLTGLKNLGERVSPNYRQVLHQAFEAAEEEVSSWTPSDLWTQLQRSPLPFELIDVRSAGEFERAHLPLSRHLPLSNFQAELFSHNLHLVVGRGPHCPVSLQAVRLLQARGVQALRLRFGLAEWQAAGLQPQSLEPWKRQPVA